MPRVVNLALAIFLLACVSPVVSTFGEKSTPVRIYLVLAVAPVLVAVLLMLASAARPGILGRALRRARRRRR